MTIILWRGRRMDKMTSEELLAVVQEQAALMETMRKDHARALEALR